MSYVRWIAGGAALGYAARSGRGRRTSIPILHADHDLTKAHKKLVRQELAGWDGSFTIREINLPASLASLPSGLYGPKAGDPPINDREVFYAVRGDREGPSRLIDAPLRPSRNMVIIAGSDSKGPVVYTAYGGQLAPREPWDRSLSARERAQSKKFWAKHALSSHQGRANGRGLGSRGRTRGYRSAQHEAQIALMRFLSEVSRRLGVGKHVYVVGGAVRNFVIDRPIKDIDVVIDSIALKGRNSDWYAHQLAQAIPVPTHLTTNQYGVAILTVKGDWHLGPYNLKGEVIEIANARKESYGGAGGKGYKPHTVAPATIQEDVVRREFTFNTLLWRMHDLARGPEKAEIIDLTGCGLSDLRKGKMACPQDPDVVFSDDPTRMLRAIKFSTKYGFTIPPDLARSIRRNAPMLKRAPWEAVGGIFINNVLMEPTAPQALQQMKDLGLLDVVGEMVQEQPPFRAYLEKQLRKRNVRVLFALLDLGMTDPTPLHYLTPAQRKKLQAITTTMPSDEADRFAAMLAKPPVDNGALIAMFQLPKGPRRKQPTKIAREIILGGSQTTWTRPQLTQAVAERMQGRRARRWW